MTETLLCDGLRSRRQLLRSLVALALAPPAALVTVQRRSQAKRPKFRLVTRRFTVSGGTNLESGQSVVLQIAQAADLPQGRVVAIAVTLGAINAPNGGNLDAMLGSGPAGGDGRDDVSYGLLISDAGNGGPAAGVPVKISSRAKKTPSRTGQLRPGTYRPTNYDGGDSDTFARPLVPFKSLLGKPAQQDWWVAYRNDGPSGRVSIRDITLTLTVKVRR